MKAPGRQGRRRGSAVLEFALGSGLLLSVMFGTFQFGFTFLQYNQLQNAVRRGAHYGAVIPYTSANATPSTAYRDAVRNMVLYGNPTGGSTPALPGLSASQVNVECTFQNGVPSYITVSVSGYSVNGLFRTYSMNRKPQVSFNYQGIWAPV